MDLDWKTGIKGLLILIAFAVIVSILMDIRSSLRNIHLYQIRIESHLGR